MMQRIEKLITDFVEDTGLTERHEIIHGTLYATLKDPKGFDDFHKIIRTFFKEEVDNEGGVNMYAVGDEFAFDFVPEDREAPVFVEPYSDEKYSGKEIMDPTDIDDKGIWSDFAEEEMFNNMPDEVDTLMNLEAESKRGK